MGLFSKKKKEDVSLPKLPELPDLPMQIPKEGEDMPEINDIHELPTFPTNSLGEKFSQDTIKSAIAGKKEEETPEIPSKIIEKPEIPKVEEKSAVIPKMEIELPKIEEEPSAIPKLETVIPLKPREIDSPTKKGPIYIRLDKFEEGIEIFEGTKEKIEEMGVLLKETKSLKEKEEEELSLWEKEIQEMKSKIEKVDKDIFSRV